jgi:nicotinate (nicotinamide) nucleotide adenylyltransferase
MEFVRRGFAARRSIALFPGAWNPPTRAHVALAEAALALADECVFVIPRAFPHKEMHGPDLDQRLNWLGLLSNEQPGFSVAISEGGLFIEMARECRGATGCDDIYLVCGADAAERIVEWDYGDADPIERQLDEYRLLVAPRGTLFYPSAHLATRVMQLEMPRNWHDVSSTDVRRRMANGESWEELVPPELVGNLRAAYVS